MSLKDWLFSERPSGLELKSLPWGTLHIVVLLCSILTIVVLALIFRKKNEKSRYTVIFYIAMLVLFFELVRRMINIWKGGITDLNSALYVLLPRPWCAISCWMIIASVFVKKKFFYNFTVITALLSAVIFFAYPDAGFKNHIAFEEVYSIGTHVLILIGSVSMITLGFTDFRYNRGKEKVWYEYICYAGIFTYAAFEIIFKIESDPLYFMPGNGVIDVLPLPYPTYLVIYILFVFGIWTNAFYLIPLILKKYKSKKN